MTCVVGPAIIRLGFYLFAFVAFHIIHLLVPDRSNMRGKVSVRGRINARGGARGKFLPGVAEGDKFLPGAPP